MSCFACVRSPKKTKKGTEKLPVTPVEPSQQAETTASTDIPPLKTGQLSRSHSMASETLDVSTKASEKGKKARTPRGADASTSANAHDATPRSNGAASARGKTVQLDLTKALKKDDEDHSASARSASSSSRSDVARSKSSSSSSSSSSSGSDSESDDADAAPAAGAGSISNSCTTPRKSESPRKAETSGKSETPRKSKTPRKNADNQPASPINSEKTPRKKDSATPRKKDSGDHAEKPANDNDAHKASPHEKPHPTVKSKSDIGSTKAIVPITSPKPAPAKRKLLKARSIALTQELMALKKKEADIVSTEMTLDDLNLDELADDMKELDWFGGAVGVDMTDTNAAPLPVTPSRVKIMLETTQEEQRKRLSLDIGEVDLDELSRALDDFADMPADD